MEVINQNKSDLLVFAESDYPYTLLEGNDNLPEMMVGRMSVRSTSELVEASPIRA